MITTLNTLKYKVARWIERYPLITILIYNKTKYFKFLLPHEKDYYGILKLANNSKKYSIIDVGANIGISSLGFRKLGLINPIYLFEPNNYIFEKFLKKLKKNNKDFYLNNLALHSEKKIKKLYLAYYKGKNIHFLSSFDKNYVINSIKITYKNLENKINIVPKNVNCVKFDSLKIKVPPTLIKLDTEGHDLNILIGMKNTIKKYKPVFLIEYNEDIFSKVCNFLKFYDPYIYNLSKDKFSRITGHNKKNISRTSEENLLTSRNIFFIPKKKINYD
tara:strand:+ start:23 stop:847 length:825 start_codon:yes stop_codon:yes gene_type:complete